MRKGRRGLSAVFGFMVIFTLLMAGLAAASTVLSSQNAVWSAQERARQIEDSRRLEHLSLSLNGSTLAVVNDGQAQVHLQYLLREYNQSTAASRLDDQLAAGSIFDVAVPSQTAGYAVITLLGSVFWLQDPSLSVGSSVPVTFDASGLSPSFNSSAVLTVDGQTVLYSQMPKTYEWPAGSSHSFAYSAGFSVAPSERVGWDYARGLSGSRQGTLVAGQPGSVVSQYSEQFLLSVVGGGGVGYLGSPADDGWYPAGSTAQASTLYAWNVTAGQSRQNLVSWNVDGSSSTAVARTGTGAFVTPGIVMDAPHTLHFGSVTQYVVEADASVPVSGSLPPLALGYSYQGPASASWSCSQFSLSNSNGGTASQGICPEPSPSQQVTSVGWNIAVSQSGTLGDALSFYVTVNGCSSQSYDATGGSAGSYSACMPESGGSIVLQWRVAPGCWSSKIQDYIYCGTSFAITSSGTYDYVSSVSGTAQTGAAAFSVSGASVEYDYPFSYGFPAGATSTSLSVTYPSSETFVAFTSPCGSWSASSHTVSVSDACASQYSLSTVAGGSYSVSLGASPTGDGWYDSGSAVTLSATATGPFAFLGWVVSDQGLGAGSSTAESTTLTVGWYGNATAVISVGE